ERLFGRHYHPIWTMIACCALMAAGLMLLHSDRALVGFAILIYGAGYGISWIAPGTLPPALFRAGRYAPLLGRPAFARLIVPGLSPTLGAFMVERYGANISIAVLTMFALVNVALIAALWLKCRQAVSASA